jgi:hypothetical protein
MSKVEKKKENLKNRIETLEFELRNSLQKKAIGPAININAYTSKIKELKKEYLEII